jgi:hypothetical protein
MTTRFEIPTLALLSTLTFFTAAQASDLTIPHTFQPNTKARAEEVNANFDATRDAVNSKQNKLTGACTTGSFVSRVNADGSLVCGTDLGLAYAYVLCNAMGCIVDAVKHFNPTGQSITVIRNSIGNYGISFNGMSSARDGHVQITPHSNASVNCVFNDFDAVSATVYCYGPTGSAIDTNFNILMIP